MIFLEIKGQHGINPNNFIGFTDFQLILTTSLVPTITRYEGGFGFLAFTVQPFNRIRKIGFSA